MRGPPGGVAALVAGAALLATGCDSPTEGASALSHEQSAEWAAASEKGPITPVPFPSGGHTARAALGERLFHEVRLSHDDSLSCAGCHPLDQDGMDRRPRAIGIGNAAGERNTPTVFNAALNFRQFWDGRAVSLETQVDGPLTNPNEMGSSWNEVLGKLGRDPSYVRAFASAYAGPVNPERIRDAIATFERTLVYTGSRFDRFLTGDFAALSHQERQGYELFQRLGCATCHQGANAGGNMFERLGIVRDFFGQRGAPSESDLGRFNVTGRAVDRFVFRVPSLRLTALTAPYLHDGSIETLDEVIRTMSKYQLGRTLADADVDAIASFLKTLPGKQGGGAGATAR